MFDEFDNNEKLTENSEENTENFSSVQPEQEFPIEPTAEEYEQEVAEQTVAEEFSSDSGEMQEEMSDFEGEQIEMQLGEEAEETPVPTVEPIQAEAEPVNPYSSQYRQSYVPTQPPVYRQPIPEVPERPKSSGTRVFLAVIALILVFALGVGMGSVFNRKDNREYIDEEQTTHDNAELIINEEPKNTGGKRNGNALSAAEVAEIVRDSNVGVVVYSGNTTSASGEGSGIVMGLDTSKTYTYIITCAHVVNAAGIKVNVQTADGEDFDAEIVGVDTRTDIGVLRVKTTKLKAAQFGDSDKLTIGSPVYAVGNPGGTEFFGSFTGGYVSAINRPVSSEIGYTMKCIQHDASINPGNSGGMLVNEYGQVVGINSQKIADTNYEGMGFAIPISSAKEVIEALISYGYVPNRPKLGITYYPVSASQQYNMIARIKGLPAGTLIINEISSDSGLAGTKARKYDMIIGVNGKDLTTADVLLELIDKGKVGDKLTLKLCRVSSNYSIEEFEVEAVLVEDKGTIETTTTESYIDPFEYFFNYGR